MAKKVERVAVEEEGRAIFIIMYDEHNTGEEAILAVRSTRDRANTFIAGYVLENEVNTAYLYLVEKNVYFEEDETE